MLGDDEDVFDSVTWETPNAANYDSDIAIISTGPGFRQSTSESNEDPHQPKWEGYLLTSVKDPVKELADTKDAYVSYLVSAKVRAIILLWDMHLTATTRLICQYSPYQTLHLVDVFKILCSYGHT
jgi:hypothetical protein